MRVVGYIRKSTADNKKEGIANRQINSLNYQRRIIKELVEKEGLELVGKIYQDDFTGYIAFQRESFQEMLGFIQDPDNQIDGIVCSELSRLARNFGDGGMILWLLQSGAITRIITYDKTFTDSSSDQLMVAVNFALSKYSSDETSFRSKQASKSKVERTKNPPQGPILGYASIGKVGEKRWIPDTQIAPLIEKLFTRYATGKYTLNEISEYAFTIGLLGKDGRKRLSKNTIRSRLADIKYTGIFIFDGETIAGDYTPIITSELFQQVQAVLAGKGFVKSFHTGYAYSGLLKCHFCGRDMSGMTKKGHIYYRCDKRSEDCKNKSTPYLRETWLENSLINGFKGIEIDEKRWREARKKVVEDSKSDRARVLQEINVLKSKIQTAEDSRITYDQAYIDKREIDKSSHTRLIQDVEARITQFKKQIVMLEQSANKITQMVMIYLDNLLAIVNNFVGASPENRRVIYSTFCENTTWDGEKLRWDWKKPYNYLVNSPRKSEWLRGKDSNLQPMR